jgi:hypothetical protein
LAQGVVRKRIALKGFHSGIFAQLGIGGTLVKHGSGRDRSLGQPCKMG